MQPSPVTSVSKTISLDRRLITGPLTSTTPACVLQDIVLAHGLNTIVKPEHSPENIRKLIKLTPIQSVPRRPNDRTPNDWSLIGRYINQHCKWSAKKLHQALTYLHSFIAVNSIPPVIISGLQTPESPTACNPCVLYKLCRVHGISTTLDSTAEQLATAVKLLTVDPKTLLRQVQQSLLLNRNSLASTHMINFLLGAECNNLSNLAPLFTIPNVEYNSIPHAKVSYNQLVEAHPKITDVPTLQVNVSPINNLTAIALAASLYAVDISYAEQPLREYDTLRSSNPYTPADAWMRYWLRLNPKLFDLTHTFNPSIPAIYYRPDALRYMLYNEGITENPRVPAYELLQIASLTDSFYWQVRPPLRSVVTLALEPIEEVDPQELVCYGNPQGYFPITLSELSEALQTQGLVSPFQANSMLATAAVTKLKVMLRSSELASARGILETIQHIESLNSESDPAIQAVLRNRSRKSQVLGLLQLLLEAGMYMRGWRGSPAGYRLEDCTVSTEDAVAVTIRVTEGITRLENRVRELGEIGRQVMNLPLFKHTDGEYVRSTDADNGYTIGERLEIVKLGPRANSMKSCIRMSSNWLCSSAHKYILLLSGREAFPLRQLRYIS